MRKIKLYKKYGRGGEMLETPETTTNPSKFAKGTGYANAGLQVANMAVTAMPANQNNFGVQSNESAIGKGALTGAATGAAMGSVAGPWGCVCAGTKVITNLGEFKSVEELKQEDGIIGWDGDKYVQQEIVGFQPPAQKECLEIETRLGHILRCSNDHPIYSSGQGRAKRFYIEGIRTRIKKYEYIDAENLKIGDNIGLINEIPIWGTEVMITPYLVGVCIGDGTYGKDKGIRLATGDSDTWKYIESNDLGYQIDKKQHLNYNKEFRIYRLKNSINLFKELGIYEQVKGNKRLPNNIHLYDKNSICKIIAGLIDTDGYVSFNSKKPKNSKIAFCQSNLELVKQVREQLTKLGIHSSLKTNKATKKIIISKECNIKESYILLIKDKHSVINFYNNIQLNILYKKQNLENFYNYIKELGVKDHKEFTNVCADKITKITSIGLQNIYNLEAAGAHTYIANLIITHNTVIGGAVGGIAGGAMGFSKNEKAKQKEANYKNDQIQANLRNQTFMYNQALASGFNPKGNADAQKYMKYGGKLYQNGGSVNQLSKTNVEFDGESHEEGGIKEPLVNGKRLSGTEVEGGETMSTSNGQKFVFSDELGFAKLHKPLASAIGKIESKMKSNPNDPLTKKTLANLQGRENQLKIKQELTKQSLGIPNDSQNLKNGGLALYPDGGLTYTASNGKQFSKSPDYVNKFGHLTYPQDPENQIVGTNQNGQVIRNGELQDRFNNINPQRIQTLNQDGIVRTPLQIDSLRKKGMLANGGLAKMGNGGPDYSATGAVDAYFQNRSNQQYMNSHGAQLGVDGRWGGKSQNAYNSGFAQPLATQPTSFEQSTNPNAYGSSNFMRGTGSMSQPSNVQTSNIPASVGISKKKRSLNAGVVNNIAEGAGAYAGALANYGLNEQARNMQTPKQALPDYLTYKPLDYTNQKLEADMQRREANQSITQNLSNSQVAASYKQQNLANTIRAKNLINQEETQGNTQLENQNRLYNNAVTSRRNEVDVENRDRDYTKEQNYITQKGKIANNVSDITQQRSRDNKLNNLEKRKIDLLGKMDSGRGVHDRQILSESIKDLDARKQSLSVKQKKFKKDNPDLFKMGGIIKTKLYNKK